MMDIRRLFSCLLAGIWLLCATASPAAAQEARTITLKEALRLGREHSLALQQAENTAAASEAAAARAQRWYLPTLSLSASPTQRYGLDFDETAGQLIQQTSQAMYLRVNAGVTLFDGFRNQASLQQARARRRSDQKNRLRQQETVVFNVLSRYLNVIEAREQLRIQEETLAEHQQQLARVEQLTSAGVQPTTDLYQQQSTVAGRKLSVNQAERSLLAARSELIAVLGLDQSGRYTFEAPPVDSSGQPQNYRPANLIERARRQRADIQAQEAQVGAAREGIQIARSSRWPRISLSGGAGTSYTSIRPSSFGGQLSNNRSGSVGLNLQIPLFNESESRQQITEAEIAHRNAELELQQLRREAAKEVRQAYDNYRLAREALTPAEQQLAAAERALRSAEQRYEIGDATFNDLAEVRQNYVQARRQHTSALYEAAFQRRILEYYSGDLSRGSGGTP